MAGQGAAAMNARPRHQRGVALLVALLVVALAVILVAALLDRGELALARTRNALRAQQAEAYARGVEIYAARILQDPSSETGADTHASAWAVPLPPQPVPGGVVGATMRDLNGCFNLNNLSTQAIDPARWRAVFVNLLAALGLDPDLATPIAAWLDAGGAGGDDAAWYLALPVPYRPRGGLFMHVSELRLVRGISGEVYARLAPQVCALPPGTRLNLDTASVPVLQALGPPQSPLSVAQAQQLWQDGNADWQGSLSDLRLRWLQQNIVIDPALDDSMVGTTSRYFLARSDIVLDDVPFAYYSLIERAGDGVRVLERSRGSDDALVAPAPVAAGGPPAAPAD